MRSIFTLAGLLVTVGVIMWAFTKYEIPVAHKGQEARQEAQQISGRDNDGTPVADTMSLEAHSANNKLDSLTVKDVTIGGAMQRYYGLQKDDQIIEVGEMAVKDMNNDGDLAISLAQQAYQEKKPLVVMRAGQRVVLAGNPTPGVPLVP